MISSIKIPLKEYTSIIDEKSKDNIHHLSKDCINNLSKVNIFVGANNSGKSRFMRAILFEKLFYIPKDLDPNKTSQIIENIKNEIFKYNANKSIKVDEIDKILKLLNKFDYLSESSEIHKNLENLNKTIKSLLLDTKSNWGSTINFNQVRKVFENIYKKNMDTLPPNILELLTPKKYKIVYIPILRGLRNLNPNDNKDQNNTQKSSNDLYYIRTQNDYFNKMSKTTQNGQNNYDVFTGLTLYEDINKMYNGSTEERKLLKDFETFLSDYFFGKKTIILIPKYDSDVISITIGDEKERPIYDVGDRLQTIIIATFPLFKYKNENLLLFIEEPEIALHPGLQRKLLNTYCENSKKAQIFITTHSNHLLDLTLDFNKKTAIYSFEKDDNEKFKIKNITPNKDILELLGVRNSSVFLSNCVIWVEGITDRLYIKKYIELYYNQKGLQHYEEDKHYSILEYGGGNITHFNFDEINSNNEKINTDSISKNNFLIADKDNVKNYTKQINESKDDAKTKRLKSFNKLLGNKFFAEHIEIENTIPYNIYKKYLKNKSKKSKNWEFYESTLIESDFNKSIKNKQIGEVLKEHFIRLKKQIKPKSFKSNTISCIGNKKDIANELIKVMEDEDLTFNDLPKSTQELIKKIIRFIKKNNTDK